MKPAIHMRRWQPGEERALFDVFHTAVHLVASRDYTPEQIDAWAPADLDPALWRERMDSINPWVAVLDSEIVGYADLQPNGYIDHFFVSGRHAGRGIGRMLMEHLLREAALQSMAELTADVSRTAQPFFERFGFVVVEQRYPERRGVVIPNALMWRTAPHE